MWLLSRRTRQLLAVAMFVFGIALIVRGVIQYTNPQPPDIERAEEIAGDIGMCPDQRNLIAFTGYQKPDGSRFSTYTWAGETAPVLYIEYGQVGDAKPDGSNVKRVFLRQGSRYRVITLDQLVAAYPTPCDLPMIKPGVGPQQRPTRLQVVWQLHTGS